MTHNQHINLEDLFQKARTNPKGRYQLLEIGRKFGFQNNINRKQIWPFLLNIDSHNINQNPVFQWRTGKGRKCEQYSVIEKDVERSLAALQAYSSASNFVIKKKQQAVLQILNELFCEYEQLNYFQGFHEIASIFSVLFDNSSAFYFTKSVGELYCYDFLSFDFTSTTYALSQLVYELILSYDSQYKQILQYFQHSKILVFILPWILSLFTRLSTSLKTISRIWDYLFCTGPSGLIYLTGGVMLSCKKQLKKNCKQYNQASIHEYFQNLPKSSQLNIQLAIQLAILLEQKIQLNQLKSNKMLNPKSRIRKQNVDKILPIHKQFHDQKRRRINNDKKFSTVVKVTGFVLVVGAALLFNKNKFKSFNQ